MGIRRGTAVTGVEQSADSVRIHTGDTPIEAAYLVGCDGGHSTVHTLAGFDFPGTSATTDVLLADVAGIDFEDIPLPREPFPFLRNEKGWIGLSQGTGGAVRVFACDFARSPVRGAGPPTFAEVRSALREIGGIDLDSYDGERRPAAARVLRLTQAQDLLLGPGAGPLRDVLLRPDGHVAWVAGDTPDRAALEDALTSWFGPPR